jgi:hypothetical protein
MRLLLFVGMKDVHPGEVKLMIALYPVCCCLQEEARAKAEEQKRKAEEARAAAAEAARKKQVRQQTQQHTAALLSTQTLVQKQVCALQSETTKTLSDRHST